MYVGINVRSTKTPVLRLKLFSKNDCSQCDEVLKFPFVHMNFFKK